MKFLIAVIFYLLISDAIEKEIKNDQVFANKKINLEIRVVDALTDDPLPAAKILIKNGKETYTNFEGTVVVEDIKLGTYDIEISFTSYQKLLLEAFQVKEPNQKLVIRL